MRATASSKECDKWTLKQGDVLFTKDSETVHEIGIPAFVSDDMPNVLCGYHLGRARPDAKVVDGSFLARALGSHQSAREFARVANGITRFGLTLDATRSLPLLLPPLAEQRAIAAVLDSIDEAIERTEQVIAATERLRDALLHDLLTRGLPGRHTEWKQVRGLGTIPACWDVVRLGDACEPPRYGASAPARPHDPSLPRYVRITDLTADGQLRDGDARSADPDRVDGYELEPGDILFARSGATVGKTYMHRTADGPCVYAGYLIRFRPKISAVQPEFLESWTHSQPYRGWVQSMLRAGAQPNINAAEYASLRLPLPTTMEQEHIGNIIGFLNAAICVSRTTVRKQHFVKAAASEALLLGRYSQRRSKGLVK